MFYHDDSLRSTSELCVRCGLCCAILNASCTPEEAEAANPGNPDRFARPDENVEKGKLRIRFPCMHLKGRTLGGVLCAVYDKQRPAVCVSYLCRIAMLYAQRGIELNQAMHQLRIAFWSGDVTIFNWCGEDGEEVLMQRQAVWKLADKLREEGNSEMGVDFWVAQQSTPSYWPSTPLEHSLFSMHFLNFDHRRRLQGEARVEAYDAALKLYYEPEEIEFMSPGEREVASVTVDKVFEQLRLYVTDRMDTEVEGVQDPVEAGTCAEFGEGDRSGGASTLEDGSVGGESEETGFCAIRGDQAPS
jgi:Fe-S-cluster containining protein